MNIDEIYKSLKKYKMQALRISTHRYRDKHVQELEEKYKELLDFVIVHHRRLCREKEEGRINEEQDRARRQFQMLIQTQTGLTWGEIEDVL